MKAKVNLAALFILVFVLLANSACAMPFLAKATSTPTPTSTPTDTPTPTSTPLPTATETSTPKPTATATPNAVATREAKLDQQAREIMAEVDLSTDSGKLGWYQKKPFVLDLKGPGGVASQISDLSTINDFVFTPR